MEENGYVWEPIDESPVSCPRQHVDYWEQVLKGPDYIESIWDDYVLPLSPSSYMGSNHSSALAHRDFITSTVLDLLAIYQLYFESSG